MFYQVHVEYNVPETGFEECAFNLSAQADVVGVKNNLEGDGAAEIGFCAKSE